MKSEHRHELKTNELAAWLSNFPEWAIENRRTLIGAGAVIIIAVSLYAWRSYNQNVQTPQQHLRLTGLITRIEQSKMTAIRNSVQSNNQPTSLAESTEALSMFAQQAGNSTLAASAHLQLAKALRAELHLRTAPTPPETIQQNIELARSSYQKAAKLAGKDANIKAAAQYGLGLCAEELNDMVEARKIYQGVVDAPALEGTAAREVARCRLEMLSTIQNTIVFQPAPAQPEPSPSDLVTDAMAPVLGLAPTSSPTADQSNDTNNPAD